MLGDGSLREILATAIVVLLVYLATLAFRLARLRHPAAREAGALGAGDATAPASAAVTLPDAAVPASTLAVPAAAPSPRFELPKLSPVHEEAAALAHEGLDIASIARRCGISEGEAELVCWLAKQRDAT